MACTADTETIDLTITGGVLTADLKVSTVVPNPLTTDGSGVLIEGGDATIALPATLAYSSGSGPTYVVTTSIDVSDFVGVGSKVGFIQSSTFRWFVVVAVNSSTLTLYRLDGSTVLAGAITGPVYSPNQPVTFPFAGPLVANNGESPPEVASLFYDASAAKWVSPPISVWSSVGADSRSANSYSALMGSSQSFMSDWLPMRTWAALGLTWQFRWTAGLSWAASMSSSGVALQAATADIGSAPAADTTTFGESLSFTANASRVLDSGWVAYPGATADMIRVRPVWKGDGTHAISISAAVGLGLSVRGRLVM